MPKEPSIVEADLDEDAPDPDETPLRDRKVFTQPYDLSVSALMDQIAKNVIFLRPLSERPNFQRRYVWTDELASRLVESILMNVPIPPCFLSQNDQFEFDVIDGQQRLYSVYRFIENQFSLVGLEVLKELNGKRFFEMPERVQRQLMTHTLRCISITNESHPEIKFDVFQRLNTNTVPLNAQELRNCVYRGALNTYLQDAAEFKPWLEILGRKTPDKRLRDEELILRFFAYDILGLATYKTPQKHWLNDAAQAGKSFSKKRISGLAATWQSTIEVCLIWFPANECFRRPGSRAINKALFDLVAHTARQTTPKKAASAKAAVRKAYVKLLRNAEFSDLISRAVDHKKRTLRRFEIWNSEFKGVL